MTIVLYAVALLLLSLYVCSILDMTILFLLSSIATLLYIAKQTTNIIYYLKDTFILKIVMLLLTKHNINLLRIPFSGQL